MIAGWPGAFKSTLALNFLTRWAMKDDFVALYVAADSDEHTFGKRCAAIMSGDPMTKIDPLPTEADPNPYNPLRAGDYDQYLRQLSNVHCEWRALTIGQIEERMHAIKQMHGKTPDLVIVDNLMNMVDNPTDYSGQMTWCRNLDDLAKSAQCHVMILHHTHESSQDKEEPAEPQPRWEIHGKVSQFPRLILTLATGGSNSREAYLMIACVKNTVGPDDRTGRTYTGYIIDTPSARVSEIPNA
jgi:hypothetical protein